MRGRTAWRLRNNPLEIDLFERSSQSPNTTDIDTTETDTKLDPTQPVEMAWNDEGNARKCLSDYARPVLQQPATRIHAPLTRGANFRIDSHVMSMLPIFHGKPFEDPYRHVEELSQVCEINHLQNVPADMMTRIGSRDLRKSVSKQINWIDLLSNALQIRRPSQFIGHLGVPVRSDLIDGFDDTVHPEPS